MIWMLFSLCPLGSPRSMLCHEKPAVPAGTVPNSRKASSERQGAYLEGVQNITSSLFRMTPIYLISVRTASMHIGILIARNFHSKIAKSWSRTLATNPKLKNTLSQVLPFCILPLCLSPHCKPSFLFPTDASPDLLTSSINSLEQLNVALLKGRIHMHKHLLRTQSSPQTVCSTSTQGHKDPAFQERYQSCNKVQGKLTAAGDRAKPSPKNISSLVIFLAQCFALLQTWSFLNMRGKRQREQDAKQLF